MNDSFTIRITGVIDGEEVHPDTFSLSDMVKLLSGLLSVVKIEARTDYGKSVGKGRLLSLDSIVDKCTQNQFSVADLAKPAVARLEAALCIGRMDDLSIIAQNKLRESFKFLFDRGACIQWVGEKSSPVYSNENPLPAPKIIPVLNERDASLMAYISKIGGENTPSIVAIFDATGDEVRASCSRELCKKMSDDCCLYETVSLLGIAKWHMDTWKLISFHATGYEKHFTGTAQEFLDTLDPDFVKACNVIDIDKATADYNDE